MSEKLTEAEKATNYETMKHIRAVQGILSRAATELIERGLAHDQSKLASPEVEVFTEFTPKLKGLTYASPEYKSCTKAMGPALQHHYANNRHHPEHFDNGIAGMTLIDLVEMFCDWLAATQRHDDGDICKSIEINSKRFGMPPMLAEIFTNTATAWNNRKAKQ